ncbi:beta-ketoacyl synthase N-terminal-like domain-containing protein [Chloroflexota bacterium]
MSKGKRKLGRGVAVAGVGMSKFGVLPGMDCRDMFAEAFKDLMGSVDKGLDPKDIEANYVGCCGAWNWETQAGIGKWCTDWANLVPIPSTTIDNACASASVAIRNGIIGIASGLYDAVLAGGVEKMTTLPTEGTTLVLATGADKTWECYAGYTFPGLYATMATAHMNQYGTIPEDLMAVAIKNHDNGVLNPKAQMPNSIKDVMEQRRARAQQKGQAVPDWANEMDFLHDDIYNPMVAWPLRLFDCCPITDGAACVLLVAEEKAKDFTDTPIYVIGTGQASGRALHDRETLTSIPATQIAAQQAYEMAGVGAQDIKIAEVHDCFTIAEIMAIADLGFFKSGKEAATAAADGKTALNGVKPINTSGGLKCKGHPVGASGAAMVAEIFYQMRGEAGARQVPNMDVNLAMSHNVGAHGTTVVVQIYERR